LIVRTFVITYNTGTQWRQEHDSSLETARPNLGGGCLVVGGKIIKMYMNNEYHGIM